MKYTKPPLTFEQQADLLLSRGMQGDRSVMIDRLGAVNYYRLSGYWHIFRTGTSHQFRPNTTFDFVWQPYIFDRRLRLLVMDAIERIEVTVRTQLAYHHSHLARSPFGYADDPVWRTRCRLQFLAFDVKHDPKHLCPPRPVVEPGPGD